MKTAIQVLGSALLLIALAGCQGASLMRILQEQGESRTAKAITAFSFASPAATGVIDENAKTIAVTVPYGTNVTALVATFTTTGSSVKVGSTLQVSGTTANNFTNPVIYTVTAADGSTVSYTVTVTVAGGSGSGGYITESSLVGTWTVSFQWSGRTPGVFTMLINADHTYQVPACPGVGASSGTLSISINGNSITMVESGPSSEGRTWTGTAASSTRFTGTLHTYSGDNTGTFDACKQVGGSSAKAITAFSFASPAATGVIDENAKTIAVTVPYGTNVTALVATFTTTGSSVKVGSTVQVSGVTANNFTNPVIYTVTAADGSTVSYTVTVTVAPHGWWTVGQAGFSAGEVDWISLAIDSSGAPYVAYRDNWNSYKATVMKYGSGSWQVVGTAGFSAGEAWGESLAIDSAGTPYVVLEDFGNSQKATVMKYAAGSWQVVGTAGFSAGSVFRPSLAIDSAGTPYVTYSDGGNSGKTTVMKYAGGSWQVVGTAGFSAGQADWTCLAIDSAGAPYVAYRDYWNGYKATVMKYAGGSWQVVGTAGFSAGQADCISLAIDSAGTPYVAYEDFGNSKKVTVMKYAAGSWQVVGTAGFSAGEAWEISIAIDPAGTAYVVYADWANGGKATVMKYAGGSWQVVGTAGFSTGMVNTAVHILVIDSSGTPYVFYKDVAANGGKATVMEFK